MHRLLQKGYKPEHLELEPRWNLGREAKGGKADILVRDHQGNPYLLIECKTTDSKNSEFAKEWAKMLENGGQLSSYIFVAINLYYIKFKERRKAWNIKTFLNA